MGTGVRHTLKKNERLSSKAGLSRLFAGGRYGSAEGIRYCFRSGNSLPYNRIVVSVPKKHFRRAVKRNLLKRRIREAYRLNKQLLGVFPDGGTDILFIYNTREVMDFAAVTASVTAILAAVSERVSARAAKVNVSVTDGSAVAPDSGDEAGHGDAEGSL